MNMKGEGNPSFRTVKELLSRLAEASWVVKMNRKRPAFVTYYCLTDCAFAVAKRDAVLLLGI